MGQQVLAIAGAVVGGVIGSFGGNPILGAEIGFALGGALGAALFPQKLSGPHTRALMAQSAAYGSPLPICYGNVRVAGTLIWQMPIAEVGTSAGGKGGPSVTSYAYYGTFAVALCEGPIIGVRKLWANGILVYDVSSTASAATVAASNQYAQQYLTIYLGSLTQGVDPTMQAALGVGNVPAYRGTAYIVFRGVPLANFGNVNPSINAEVVTAGAGAGIRKAWENDAVASPTAWSGALTAVFSSLLPTIRIADQARSSFGTPDGIITMIDTATGNYTGLDVLNTYESSLPSVHTYRTYDGISGAGNGLGSFQFEPTGSYFIGVNPADATFTVDASHRSVAFKEITSFGYAVNGPVDDVIAKLTPGGAGWAIVSQFTGGDQRHCAIISTDSVNCYFHIVNLNSSDGSCTEILRYTYPIASFTGALTQNATGGGGSVQGCLESDLSHFWIHVPSGNSGTIYRCTATPTSLTQDFSASAWTDTTQGKTNTAMAADFGICCMFVNNVAVCWTANVLGAIQKITLSTIITDICERAGVLAGNINATALTDGVWGFAIDRQMSARQALEVLAPTFWFDAVESDTTLKFVHRSGTPVATIPLDDMVVGSSNNEPLAFTRGSEIELPTQLNISYLAVGADYQPGLQYARRVSTSQQNSTTTFDAACVMDDTQAAVSVAVMFWDTLAGRSSFKFATTMKWAQLEPTDIVLLPTPNATYMARLTRKTEAAGRIDWEAMACAPIYSQVAAGGAITAGQNVSGNVPTSCQILDIAPLRDQDGDAPNLYVAMYGATGWPGGTLFKSYDSGATFVAGISMGTMSTAGGATSVLGTWTGGNVFDEKNTVDVSITSGQTLSSVSDVSVLNGANVALVGNEIIQFKNATLISTGRYRLSGLLRGRFATEGAYAGHSIGERFVLLTGVVGLQSANSADIGAARIYDAVTIGQPIGTGLQQTITEAGNTLKCFSPVYLNATNNAAVGDITLTWVRRNRKAWQWLPAVDVPMSEATEAYVVSIFNGAGTTVLRTINVSAAQTVVYTSAQQVTDFGAAIAIGGTLIWGVQQVSAIVGVGAMAKVTSVMPITVPGAPTIGTASAGDTTATVAFTAPASNGGSAITSYTAKSSPGGITASGASSPITVTGLTNGTAYTFTVTATNAAGTGPASAASNSVTPSAGGFASTVLLHFDGTNGSTTMTDVHGHTWIAVGSAALSTAQFKFGSASLLLNPPDIIKTNCDHSDFNFLAGQDFTVECWFYWTGTAGSSQCLFGKCKDASSQWAWLSAFINPSGNIQAIASTTATSWDYNETGGAVSANAWHHLRMVRSSNTLKTYLDGIAIGAGGSYPAAIVDQTDSVLVIGAGDAVPNYTFKGYVDEFSISLHARNTANFTPPASAYSESTTAYNLYYLGHFDGTNGATTFTEEWGHAFTNLGSPQLSTAQSKFGTASLYCNTVGGATLPAAAFGAEDFTIHLWFYPTTATGVQILFALPINSSTQGGVELYTSGGVIGALASTGGGTWQFNVTGPSPSLNAWHHAAITRSGTTINAFLDGTSYGSGTVTGALANMGPFAIGSDNGGGRYFSGYIDEFQYKRALADWTSNFTPPSSAGTIYNP
jgi:hypothetical protein